jgi:hypothetical protein
LIKLRVATFLAFAGLIALLPKPARANSITYDFGGCTDGSICSGPVGITASYTSKGYKIQATAFSSDSDHLFIKKGTGDERGLGMTGTTKDEIQPGEFIQLDVSSLASAGFTSGSLMFGSVQPGEGYKICVSNATGIISINCITGHLDVTPVNVNFKGYKYIDVTATTGDVLLAKGFIAAPEPSSLMLLGSGLLALVGLTLKKALV